MGRYDPDREFGPWLTKICVNTYRSALRRLVRGRQMEIPGGEEKERLLQSLSAPEGKDYSPLYDAVDRLPDRLRVTVVLFYFEGMDLASTAEVLGIPAGTVKSRLNKARKLLKEVLADETELRF